VDVPSDRRYGTFTVTGHLNIDSCVILEFTELNARMNRQRKTLHLLLAFLVAVSIVLLSAHNYSHSQSGLTACQLCIHHDNSGSAITLDADAVFFASVPDTFVQVQQPAPPPNTDFYHQPSRAPPPFT